MSYYSYVVKKTWDGKYMAVTRTMFGTESCLRICNTYEEAYREARVYCLPKDSVINETGEEH